MNVSSNKCMQMYSSYRGSIGAMHRQQIHKRGLPYKWLPLACHRGRAVRTAFDLFDPVDRLIQGKIHHFLPKSNSKTVCRPFPARVRCWWCCLCWALAPALLGRLARRDFSKTFQDSWIYDDMVYVMCMCIYICICYIFTGMKGSVKGYY